MVVVGNFVHYTSVIVSASWRKQQNSFIIFASVCFCTSVCLPLLIPFNLAIANFGRVLHFRPAAAIVEVRKALMKIRLKACDIEKKNKE